MAEKKSRLGPQEWINAGFRALTEKGPEGLRVEPIARSLGATKGSFYWHFKDLAALQDAMLRYWEDAAATRIIARLEELPPGLPRLQALIAVITRSPDAQGGQGAEAAIRGWGRSFDVAGAAVRRVDAQRLAFLRDCFAAMGLKSAQLPELFYAAHLGLEQLSLHRDVDADKALTQLLDLLSRKD